MSIKTLVGIATIGLACLVASASASASAPVWKVTSQVAPSNLAPGSQGTILLNVGDLGDEGAEAGTAPIVIHDILPPGITATAISGGWLGFPGRFECTLATVTCEFEGAMPLYTYLPISISVAVAQNVELPAVDRVTVAGGGGVPAAVNNLLKVNPSPVGFGVESLQLEPENEDGSPATQAGSHPFQLTTTVFFNQKVVNPEVPANVPAEDTKDLHFNLPPGMIGNPQVVPQCTNEQFLAQDQSFGLFNLCPDSTAIGVATVFIGNREEVGSGAITVPLFNLVPAVGEPARFGFKLLGQVPITLDTSVRTGGDYGVTVSVKNITQVEGFLGSQVTFWGVPADARHDNARGWDCLDSHTFETPCVSPGERQLVPFLTMPTSCEGAFRTTVETDSWVHPNVSAFDESTLEDGAGNPLGLTDCERLDFKPSISLVPDGQAGATPTGLTVGVHVPQYPTLNPTGLAEADVRDTTVALPLGVALNPAAADGLLSCSIEQIGLQSSFAPSCPEGSKVGTVQIKTPLLQEPLEGFVYLAAQDANPFGSLIALYIVAEDPTAGVIVKFAGQVTPDPVTGQLVSTFQNTPQLPFEDLHLKFFGGDRAPLATPASCGTYTTSAAVTPWSGNEPVLSSSSFEVTSGPHGSSCADPLPFSPSLTAGTTSVQAGGFTPFTMTMSREDGNQNLQAISLHMPPGLLGLLSSVKLCEEPQADAGTCSPESEIGETIVSVGLGGDPFSVRGGKVYITGPYEGAPFGLSIVNPAKAGPYDLGQVIVRAKIEVDPLTAALTITSDSTGPYKIPTILDGIPLQIKHVNVTVDRPGFTFNPTSCAPMRLTGAITSTEGADASFQTPFQVTNCAALAFKPSLKVSSAAKTSRAAGASLDVKLVYPKATFGSQANIAKVKVDLPRQLPSRLSTLQKACPDNVFDVNPANCSAASRIGSATATTPLLSATLAGPVYFVSHGGTKFPELVVVLQGDGVTIDLHGETFISPAGITSSTFAYVPDAPVSSFELKLPEGKFSALAANGNLCDKKLVMPTHFVAQNGAELHQNTPIGVEGCSYALSFVSHEIKKNTATLSIYVPVAGEAKVSGKGLPTKSTKAKGRETLTFKLTQLKAGRLKTRVVVLFTSSAGKDRKKQSKSMTLNFKR